MHALKGWQTPPSRTQGVRKEGGGAARWAPPRLTRSLGAKEGERRGPAHTHRRQKGPEGTRHEPVQMLRETSEARGKQLGVLKESGTANSLPLVDGTPRTQRGGRPHSPHTHLLGVDADGDVRIATPEAGPRPTSAHALGEPANNGDVISKTELTRARGDDGVCLSGLGGRETRGHRQDPTK